MPEKYQHAGDKAKAFVLELWEHYKEWLSYGGTVPLWLAVLEPKLREVAESIEKENWNIENAPK